MGRDWIRDLRKWAEEKGLRKWFKRDNFIILVLAGILLIIIGLPVKDGRDAKEDSTGLKTEPKASGQSDTQDDKMPQKESEASDANVEYTAMLEERLTESLSRIAGVGKVKVMITLKSSQELVVEKEQQVSRSSTNESDFQGGSRITSQSESGENTIYSTDGSLSEPYVIKTIPPQIEGVLVVAEGAGSGTVNHTIVEIIQALFGVDAHKVQVVKME